MKNIGLSPKKPYRSSSRQNMCRHLWHTPKISPICWRVKTWSVVLWLGQKPHWISSSFRSFISQHLFSRHLALLRSEILSGMCAKLRTVAASNNIDHPTRSLYYCLFAPQTYIFVLSAHPVRGESHNQRNTTGEVATTSLRFYNEPHPSHVLCVKAELRTTSTSWSQHHFFDVSLTL